MTGSWGSSEWGRCLILGGLLGEMEFILRLEEHTRKWERTWAQGGACEGNCPVTRSVCVTCLVPLLVYWTLSLSFLWFGFHLCPLNYLQLQLLPGCANNDSPASCLSGRFSGPQLWSLGLKRWNSCFTENSNINYPSTFQPARHLESPITLSVWIAFLTCPNFLCERLLVKSL